MPDLSLFAQIAKQYDANSFVQKSACDTLLDLLQISARDDVLDLGCGTGNVTKKVRALTEGRVVGIDAIPEMIEQAKKNCEGLDITFNVERVEEMSFDACFDVITSNSSLQWFTDFDVVAKNCFKAIRLGGRLAGQVPATSQYCPNFIKAIELVGESDLTKSTFSHFKSPWLFLETAEEYKAIFQEAGFLVLISKIVAVSDKVSPEDAMRVFESGAAVGYLAASCYEISIDDNYRSAFRNIVLESLKEQAGKDGKLNMVFNRLFLLAVKA